MAHGNQVRACDARILIALSCFRFGKMRRETRINAREKCRHCIIVISSVVEGCAAATALGESVSAMLVSARIRTKVIERGIAVSLSLSLSFEY